jgi:hypothetical protein
MNKKDITDDDLMYTFHGLYGGNEPPAPAMLQTEHGDNYIARQGELAHATTVPTTTVTSGGGSPAKTTHVKPMGKPKIAKVGATKSAAERDSIKASKSNSNIVKHKDALDENLLIQDHFVRLCDTVRDKPATERKLNLMVGTKLVYDEIKDKMKSKLQDGISAAFKDLGLEEKSLQVQHDLYTPLDKLRDSVVSMVAEDPSKANRAGIRISTANKTEQMRAYNYGYALACVANNVDSVDMITDSAEVVDTLALSEFDLSLIPPYRPNSKVTLKIKPVLKDEIKIEDGPKELSIEDKIKRDREVIALRSQGFSVAYLIKTYGYTAEDFDN